MAEHLKVRPPKIELSSFSFSFFFFSYLTLFFFIFLLGFLSFFFLLLFLFFFIHSLFFLFFSSFHFFHSFFVFFFFLFFFLLNGFCYTNCLLILRFILFIFVCVPLHQSTPDRAPTGRTEPRACSPLPLSLPPLLYLLLLPSPTHAMSACLTTQRKKIGPKQILGPTKLGPVWIFGLGPPNGAQRSHSHQTNTRPAQQQEIIK